MELKGSEEFVNKFSVSKRTKIDRQVLPNDLVNEVLERLPVKSLLRFKCVSKWWYALIKSPIFVENQFQHRSGKSRTLLVMNYSAFSFHDLDSPKLEQVRPKSSVKLPNSAKLVTFCLGGSWSKGIVCIMYRDSIRLCNPSLSESKLLPTRPRIGRRKARYDEVLGRGFGITCTGEFKVILVRDSPGRKQTSTFPAHLYSSSTNSWKQIADAPYEPVEQASVFFSGACHWYANDDGNANIILSIDMTTEIFKRLEISNDFSHRLDIYDYTLAVINDCLASVRSFRYSTSYNRMDVWVMKEYGIKESWTKQYVLKPQMQHIITPLLSWKNDEWLLMEYQNNNRSYYTGGYTGGRKLACISFLTNETQSYQVKVAYSATPLLYEESLVSLK